MNDQIYTQQYELTSRTTSNCRYVAVSAGTPYLQFEVVRDVIYTICERETRHEPLQIVNMAQAQQSL